MTIKKVFNITQNCFLAEKAKEADSFMSRLVGLISRKCLAEKEGLIILNTSAIHTVCMRFPIDVIFFNKDKTIAKIILNMKPYRISPWVFNAFGVVELPVGIIKATRTKEGDKIEIKDI